MELKKISQIILQYNNKKKNFSYIPEVPITEHRLGLAYIKCANPLVIRAQKYVKSEEYP